MRIAKSKQASTKAFGNFETLDSAFRNETRQARADHKPTSQRCAILNFVVVSFFFSWQIYFHLLTGPSWQYTGQVAAINYAMVRAEFSSDMFWRRNSLTTAALAVARS